MKLIVKNSKKNEEKKKNKKKKERDFKIFFFSLLKASHERKNCQEDGAVGLFP